jgi:hypothetical protein
MNVQAGKTENHAKMDALHDRTNKFIAAEGGGRAVSTVPAQASEATASSVPMAATSPRITFPGCVCVCVCVCV